MKRVWQTDARTNGQTNRRTEPFIGQLAVIYHHMTDRIYYNNTVNIDNQKCLLCFNKFFVPERNWHVPKYCSVSLMWPILKNKSVLQRAALYMLSEIPQSPAHFCTTWFRAWICNQINTKQWEVITNPCQNWSELISVEGDSEWEL